MGVRSSDRVRQYKYPDGGSRAEDTDKLRLDTEKESSSYRRNKSCPVKVSFWHAIPGRILRRMRRCTSYCQNP